MNDSRSSSLALLPLAAIESLLGLFQSQAEDLRFPGVSKEALEAQLEVIKLKNEAVADAEAALAEARDQLALAGEDVLQLAKKAHAYLSVYAQENPELSAELQKVKLSENNRASKATRKKRSTAASQKKTAAPEVAKADSSSNEPSEDTSTSASLTEQVLLEAAVAAE